MTLKFSVELQAATTAFNAAVKQAAANYGDTTASIRKDSNALSTSAAAAGESLYKSLNIKPNSALTQEIAKIGTELQKLKQDATIPAGELNRVTQAAAARINELKRELTGVQPAANQAATSIKGIGTSITGVLGVTAGLASVALGIKAIVDAGIKFEAVNKQLEYAVGSSKNAAVEFEFIKKSANELGIDLLSAANGYSKLAVATKGTTLEGKATRDVFLGVSQAAATMGLSADETNGVFLALSQIAGKGKVSMEELRGQLGERLPAAMGIAAKSMGVTVEELNKIVEAGLDSELFLKSFGPALQQAFSADAAKNITTVQGRITLMRNEFNLLLKDLSDSGVGTLAAGVFAEITKSLGDMREAMKSLDPKTVDAVKAAFETLYKAIKDTFGMVFSAINDVGEVLKSLGQMVSGVVGAFTGFKSAGDDVSILTRALQGVSVLLGTISDGMTGMRIVLTAVTGVVQDFFSSITYGLSKITFGAVSEEFLKLSFDLKAAAKRSYDEADAQAQAFTSKAVGALDRAAGAAVETSKAAGAAHTAAAKEATNEIAKIAKGSTDAGNVTVTAAIAASQELKKIGNAAYDSAVQIGGIGKAATEAKTQIEVFSGNGGSAVLNLNNATNEARKAFTDLGKDSGITLPALAKSSDEAGIAMGFVAKASAQAADEISKNLPAAIKDLNATDLAQFKASFIGGLEKAGVSSDYINKSLVTLTNQGVKSLGTDLAAAMTGLSKGFVEGQTTVAGFGKEFDVLKKAGINATKLIEDNLTALLTKAKNPAEIEAVIALWVRLGKEGKVGVDELTKGLAEANKKLDESKSGINSVGEAFRKMGLTTREESAVTAKALGEAYDTIKNSGQATASQLQESFKKYAEAAIAANGGVASAFITGEAEARGLKVTVDEAGNSIVSAMNKSANSTDKLSGRLSNATTEAERLTSAIEGRVAAEEKSLELARRQKAVNDAKRGVDAEGFSLDATGKRAVSASTNKSEFIKEAIAKGLTPAEALALADESSTRVNGFSGNGLGGKVGGTVEVFNSNKFYEALEKAVLENIRKQAKPIGNGFSIGGQNFGQNFGLDPRAAEQARALLEKTRADEFLSRSLPTSPQPSKPNNDQGKSGKTINVNFILSGKAVSATINQSDEGDFLDMLARAKGVS